MCGRDVDSRRADPDSKESEEREGEAPCDQGSRGALRAPAVQEQDRREGWVVPSLCFDTLASDTGYNVKSENVSFWY